jgi:hypothetical protein
MTLGYTEFPRIFVFHKNRENSLVAVTTRPNGMNAAAAIYRYVQLVVTGKPVSVLNSDPFGLLFLESSAMLPASMQPREFSEMNSVLLFHKIS